MIIAHENRQTVAQTLQMLRRDISHVREDVDLLKSIMIDDSFLTEEEKNHLEKTIKQFTKGEMKEFVSLDDV